MTDGGGGGRADDTVQTILRRAAARARRVTESCHRAVDSAGFRPPEPGPTEQPIPPDPPEPSTVGRTGQKR